ncbi:MAG: Gfo/Idh/MocA family oxidoreductase [Chitinophagaceae bacterium]|nr:Gfo/Idh/MocA family oxidoreductase [Chitinophagaceae bacterium]
MTPIRTALLSFGMSGKVFHAPFIHLHKGFQLVGAWERTKQLISEIYPGTISYPTMEALLADESIQLVVVNTPNYTHYEYAKAALLAGKDVIVEKAFTTTVAEAVELKQLAEKTGRKIGVFQSRRWDSDFKTVRKIVESKQLGNIIEAALRFDRFRPVLSAKLHKEANLPGAGLLNDLGPHLTDQALCLFGMPQAVYADVRITREHSIVDDWFEMSLHYPNSRVSLKAGFFSREPLPAFVLHGTKGSFIKTRGDVQETYLLAGIQPNITGWGTEPDSESGYLFTDKEGIISKEKITTEPGNYYYYYDEVYNAITQNKPMPVTGDDGINVMAILEAAAKSSKEKRVIEL